ncbi:NAD(P)-dependent alcohol dehydrogenase [Selenomonadales bacterium OttesenSCG-928-I06]|nr:NAD(P)-dependent alcohol dehydrogenase [Selenomonadales bacterium OttesenSCG-928-I06]
MRAALTLTPGSDFFIDEVELAPPKKTEVLVKMVGVGVCHTDVVAQHQGLPVPLPAVLGHEGAGIVQEIGSDVTDVKVGDHVALTFYSCARCSCCRSGFPNLCEFNEKVNLFGGVYADDTKRITYKGQEVSCFFGQSTFAEYAVTDQENCVVVDKDVDLAIMGPLGCGFQTGAGAVANKLRPEVGSSIVIFGCGAVGLCAIMMAKNSGCTTIIGVDLVESRLGLAKELGATHVINDKSGESVVAKIKEITKGGADYSIETTAVPDVINQALYCLKLMGTCVLLGSTGEKIVPIKTQYAIMGPGKTLAGVIEGNSIPKLFIPKLIDLYKRGMFPIDKLIKEYKFEDINQAVIDSHKGIAIKPIIRF